MAQFANLYSIVFMQIINEHFGILKTVCAKVVSGGVDMALEPKARTSTDNVLPLDDGLLLARNLSSLVIIIIAPSRYRTRER